VSRANTAFKPCSERFLFPFILMERI